MNRDLVRLCAALAFAAVLFSININGYDLWPPDEPRYALIAREMMDSGDYLLPRVNNQPYKEKPPLLFWMIAAASSITGEVTPLTARIPSVVSGLIVLLFTGLLAREVFNARIALWSVLILMTMQRFWWNSRFGQIDMLLSACLTAGLYGYWRWEASRRYGWLVLFYAAAMAGLFAKGPGVLVFPVLFVLVRSWKSERPIEAWTHLVVGCACCILAYAAWVIPTHLAFAQEVQETAGNGLASNMFRQTIGRFFLGVSHANWPWYYLTTLPVDWLPWTLFLPWVAVWVWKQRKENASVRFLFSWILPAFLFFTVAIGKRGVYLLPLFPAFAILFAAGILEFIDKGDEKWKLRISWFYSSILLLSGCIALFAPAIISIDIPSVTLSIIGACLVLPVFPAMPGYINKRMPYLHLQFFASFVLLCVMTSFLVFPLVNQYKSARGFCSPIANLTEKDVEFDLYSVGFAREEYVFYSRHFFKELYTGPVPLEGNYGMGELEMLKFQKEFSRAITKSVETVQIQDIKAIRPDEVEALRAALQETVGKKGYPEALIEDFKNGLRKEADEFFAVFSSDRPAFLYVQDYDWRWIYAIHPDMHGAVVLDHEDVGSRSVLLVANPAGAALMGSGRDS
jgi:4-amino-4-deoxy-L-arabinose transferase-like glycosyltransferase